MSPENPYVTGNAVGNSPAFVGRADVWEEVLRVLSHSTNNAIVLYGQRRIGKTSVLKELEARLPKEKNGYIPVFFDLQGKAQNSVGQLLQELARKISDVLQKNRTNKKVLDLGDNPEMTFHNKWLPDLLKKLPQQKSLVLLFDEFDVLVAPNVQVAAAAFFPYLRDHLLTLNTRRKRLNFVFVIGRRIDDLNQVALSVLKATNHKRVSLLNYEDTVKLICLSQTNKTLEWKKEAINKVWQLTSGHPYLTQVLCSQIWYKLRDNVPQEAIPIVTSEDIEEKIIDKTVEASEGALEWLWDGLPPAERVVASALAEQARGPLTEEQLQQLFLHGNLKMAIPEQQNAVRVLQQWELIEPVEESNGYRFRVEILRQWVKKHKPFSTAKEEWEKLDPLADRHYQIAWNSYEIGDLEQAIKNLEKALERNPYHLSANQLLGEIWIQQEQYEKALQPLEQQFQYQPTVAKPRLIQALTAIAAKAAGKEEEQLKYYDRILEIDSEHQEAWLNKGEIAQRRGEFTQALEFYHNANRQDKVDEIQKILEKQGDEYLLAGSLEKALELYQRAKLGEKVAKVEQQIWQRQGDEAYNRGDWQEALAAYQKAKLSDKIAKVEQQIWQKQGDEAYNKGDWQEAIVAYQKAKLNDKVTELEKKIRALQEFEKFLNEAVAGEEATEIGAIFLYAPLKYNKVIHSVVSAGKQPPLLESLFNYLDTVEAKSFIEELRNSISNVLSPKATTIQFADCFLNLYFETEVPVTIGFLSTSAEGLGGFKPQCDKHLVEIKDRFSQIP
ncbi:MAG: hypothetical protein BWK78_01960 [Thiotrichaceae bacterium IS1]|nr:MAG: hypothetical protein BWK78_01960 [Thiotrichaceae bacterium IS1]